MAENAIFGQVSGQGCILESFLKQILMKTTKIKNITFIHGDCMDFLRECGENEFDLAIVDPPYGIKRDGQKSSTSKHGGRKSYKFKGWDNHRPSKVYFENVFNCSVNQIIAGANYFSEFLPPSMGWVFWDKGQRICNSDGELFFTSFNRALRVFVCNRVELLKDGTIHPTQKPVKLYEWLLMNYAKEGDRILDTHGGSGSIAIACHNLGFELTIIEKDKEYFDNMVKRFRDHIKQLRLF